MYRACTYREHIRSIEVVKLTPHRVTYASELRKGNVTEARISDSHAVFESFDEAKQWLISLCQKRIDAHSRILENARKELAKLQALKEN